MSTVNLSLVNEAITAEFYIEGTTAGPAVGNVALLNLDGNVSNVLHGDGTWGVGGGGGTATVAGDDTQLQYNNAGALGAITGVTSNGTAIFANIANVKINGGADGQAIITDGYGNLSFGQLGYTSVGRIEFNSPSVFTNNPTFYDVRLAYYNDDAASMNIFVDGILSEPTVWSLTGTTLSYTGFMLPNTQIDITPQFIVNTGGIDNVVDAAYINAVEINANRMNANYFFGDGGNITNINTDNIANGTTFANVSSAGHFRVYVDSGLKIQADDTDIELTGNLYPSANITYDLGSATRRWKDLYLSNNTIYLDTVAVSATSSGLTVGGSAMATETFVTDTVTDKITELVGAAPAALDTLVEIGTALGNDANFAGTMTNALANKASITYVDTGLAAKVDTTTYTTGLAAKVDTTTYTTGLAAKASIEYVDDSIANVTVDLTGYATETFVGDAIANAHVAVANVTGIGNIATVNLDGNASNILYGNGAWSAAPGGGSGSTAVSTTVAVPSAGWTGSGPYTQVLTVATMTTTKTFGIDIDMSNVTYANISGVQAQYATIYRAVGGTGNVTLYSTSPPSSNLSIIVGEF